MKDKLEKYYDTFTVKERIDLTIAALARGDREEFLRFRDSCPKNYYKATDANYTNCMEDLTRIGISYNLY